MGIRIARSFHMSIEPSLMARTVQRAVNAGEDWRQFFENPDPSATWDDYKAALLARTKPIIMGDCDNVGEDGTCQGHDEPKAVRP